MKSLIILTVVSALCLVGCGSSEQVSAEPAIPAAQAAPADAAPSSIAAPPPAEAGGLPPENASGSAIKANELGPQ
jgi:hypothetical protein